MKLQRHIRLPSSSSAAHSQNPSPDVFSYFNQSLDSSLVDIRDIPLNVMKSNCSLPPKPGSCSFVQFEALLNLADRTVCRCKDSKISVGNRCNSQLSNIGLSSPLQNAQAKLGSNVSIFAVTPTYTRYTQKVDLTSLCYTIQYVPNFIWIVVEDAMRKTKLVANVLERCKVRTIMLCSGRSREVSCSPLL